jgi:transposase
MTEKQQQQLGDILDSGPVAYGLDTGIWTSLMIARAIEAEFGVQYHPGHVRKLLHG